jgi:energy-coupling factor transporter ATP-binding protein EcfA2
VLHRLELQNFYSVRQPQAIDLRMTASVPDVPGRFAPLFAGSDVQVPKVIALFGPNASGKSTVLRALAFLSWFVQHSFQWPPASDQPTPTGFQPCERFFASEAATEPTRLCVHFTGPTNFSAPVEEWKTFCRYAYEVCFESAAGKPRNVLSESFRQWPRLSGKSVRVFERDAKANVTAGNSFSVAGYRNVLDKVRSNASVVSTLAQFDHKPSLVLRQVAAKVISNILIEKVELADSAVLQWYNTTPQTLDALNKQLERIDVGIKGMRLAPGPQGPMAFFDHEGLNVPVPLNLESPGTRQFVRIFPIISHAISVGGLAVIDELDQSIHPFVLSEIIRWFHDPKRNPNDAQLWMTCQNAAILEELEKEEIFFAEKDVNGRTKLFGLQDIQSVRRSDNFFKKYLGGVYGAVPHLG